MDEQTFHDERKVPPGKRMTLAQCRKVAPELADLSDEEVLEARDAIYEYAEIVYEAWQIMRPGSKSPAGTLTSQAADGKLKIWIQTQH